MNTIKGYKFDTGRGFLMHRTPAARLAFFRSLRADRDWRAARDQMGEPESSELSPGHNIRPGFGSRPELRTPVMRSFGGAQFRNECWANERPDVRGMRRAGWFTDAECSTTLRAFVFHLPHGRFGGGYANSFFGERVYLLGVWTNAHDAAMCADREARYNADQEKQYSERWTFAQNLIADIAARKAYLSRSFSTRHSDTSGRSRAKVQATIDAIRGLHAELKDGYADVLRDMGCSAERRVRIGSIAGASITA